MSWLGKLQAAKAETAAQNVDPWMVRLERVRGHVCADGIERISTQTLFDHLRFSNEVEVRCLPSSCR
jgi:hypothetical protein